MVARRLNHTAHGARDRSRYGSATKRAFDVVGAAAALALLLPLFGLLALAIKRDSPGPVFFRGARMGRAGREFAILKFRTMYETPASYAGPKVTAHDDPRVTPLGRWLRNTKLNELPQFYNVLRGDMSLVGPRPEDPDLARGWPRAVQEAILSVRPGITSPASVLYHDEEALLCAQDVLRQYVQEVGPDKQRLDRLYVQHCSFCLDLDTLLWTALILLPRIRAHEPPEQLLFVGPVTRLVHRYLNWFLADLLVVLAAVGCTGIVWRVFGPLNVGWPRAIAAALALALLFSIEGALLGVNRIAWSKAAPEDVGLLVVAWSVAAGGALLANRIAGVLPAGLVVIASLLALLGFVALRYRTRLVTGAVSEIVRYRTRALRDRERVLIVGSGRNAQLTAWLLRQPENVRRFQVCGFLDDDLYAQGLRIHGVAVVGTLGDIPALVRAREIHAIVLADPEIAAEQIAAVAGRCRAAHVRFVRVPDLAGSLAARCQGVGSMEAEEHPAGDCPAAGCLECLARRRAEGV
jgi:lipopolysaccharide/colanic/teichoic acid biosynthesis glycosyltransferase